MGYLEDRKFIEAIEEGEEVTIAGWAEEVTTMGGLVFVRLRDKTGLIQLKFEEDTTDESLFKMSQDINRQSSVVAKGSVEEDDRAPGGIEVVPHSVEVVAESETGLPLDPSQKVGSEMDTRLENRTLDLRSAERKAIFSIRAGVLQSARDTMREHKATEINSSKIVATGTEGGAELFPITYFGEEAFMNQSPQLFKQLIATSSMERVFEVGPIFRAESHNTSRHLCEATSIDFEASFMNDDDVMDVCEDVVLNAYEHVKNQYQEELSNLDVSLEELDTPFERITYEEAIEMINTRSSYQDTLEFGDDLPADAERALGDVVDSHYFITNWPSEIKPFYIKDSGENESLSTGFDLMHPRLELVSGGQREHRYDRLVEGFEQQGLDAEQFDYYTEAFRYGIPPHAGWGLGADRLVMTMLGLDNIREAVLFPRDRNRIQP